MGSMGLDHPRGARISVRSALENATKGDLSRPENMHYPVMSPAQVARPL